MFYAVPRPTRDGSKVNVGRPGPGGSSGVVWKQELGGGEGGSSNNGRERGKSVLGERKKDRGTIGGQREEGARGVCRAKGAKRWDWPVLLWPPRGTPIARMRAKVKLRQVVTLLLPLSLPRHEPMRSPHPCRVHRAAPFSLSARLLLVLRFLEVTSFPRETICGYGGRIVIARSGAKQRRFVACVGCFGGCLHTIWRSRSDNFLDELLTIARQFFLLIFNFSYVG